MKASKVNQQKRQELITGYQQLIAAVDAGAHIEAGMVAFAKGRLAELEAAKAETENKRDRLRVRP